MKALKRFANLVFVLCVLASAPQVQATVMPVSTYATAQDNWQGSKTRSEIANDGSTFLCRVEYAVYDTSLVLQNSQAEKDFFESVESSMSNMERFLYVYQVFNLTDTDSLDSPVAYFAVFNLDETELNISTQNIGSENDDAGGIGPSGSGLSDDETKVVWNFAGGALIESAHSWFLVLTSDSGPVKGDYKIGSSQSDFPTIPEPATIALLFSGAMMIAGWKKRK
jgi:hypothetical protein